MISTSVAISAAISRPAISASLRVSLTSMPRMKATSSSEKPSSDNNKNAWRGNGVMFDSRRSEGIGSVVTSASSLSETEFQIWVNRRNSPRAGRAARRARMRPGAGLRASQQHRRRPMPGFPSARGHSGAVAVNVQQLAVIGTSPLHGLSRLKGYLAQSSPGSDPSSLTSLITSEREKGSSLPELSGEHCIRVAYRRSKSVKSRDKS